MRELLSQVIDNSHFLVIHFPISLLSTGWLLDVIAVSCGSRSAENGGLWSLFLGVLSSIVAIGTGFLADRLYGHMALPFSVFNTHGAIQIISSLIFIGLLFWRYFNKGRIPTGGLCRWYLFLGGVAVAILFYGAHLGAELSGRL